jgi:hypothetical protein
MKGESLSLSVPLPFLGKGSSLSLSIPLPFLGKGSVNTFTLKWGMPFMFLRIFLIFLNCGCFYAFFFFSFLGWVRLSQLGTSATNWPIVPALDDRWWVWSSRWNENWQGKPKYSEKTCPSATLSTTNPTWSDLGSNPSCRGGKPATNSMSYGTTSQIH